MEGAPNRTLESAILIMGINRFRRLPITKLGKLRGIITVTDIIKAISKVGLPNAFKEEISSWMTLDPVTVSPNLDLKSGIKLMSEKNIGSLLILDDVTNTLRGIITERDILHHHDEEIWNTLSLKKLGDKFLTKDFVMINSKASLEDSINMMNTKNTHSIMTLDDEGNLNGILTANDITSLCSREREEISLNPNFLKSVNAEFVSTSNPLTVDLDTTVSKTIKIMREQNIGSLPILENSKLIGIFSERTLIHLIASS